ncbi:AI-2E family transporter [Saccharospirillum sp.]|uniref:AI-2E family transporter n=1 Tax=Saccharospirillum sp. TaxID=2033801 RepID=UPI0034A0433F
MFSAGELRLFRYTSVMASLVALTALIGISVWALSWILGVFYNLLLSLSIAGILALVLHPVVEFLERRLHLPHLLATIFVLVAFFTGVGSLFFLLVPIVVNQVIQLLTVLPDLLASWQAHFSFSFPEISSMISSNIESNGEEESESVMPDLGSTSSAIMSYLGFLVGLSFVPLFLFFTLLSGGTIRGQITELLSVFRKPTQQKSLYFLDMFVEYVTTFFQGQLIIAVSMGILYAVGFTLVSLKLGILIGLVLGLLNIVPFLGSLIGLLVVLPMAYLQPDGGIQLLLLAGVVFAAVQLVESWLLTPKIMANRSGLHPALVVISLFFWGIVLGGVIGMVLAVPLTAFIVAIWSEVKASLKRNLDNREIWS